MAESRHGWLKDVWDVGETGHIHPSGDVEVSHRRGGSRDPEGEVGEVGVAAGAEVDRVWGDRIEGPVVAGRRKT